jgi:hypothetical protein
MKFNRKKVHKAVWDYDLDKSDLEDEQVKIWFLTRKINNGDFGDLNLEDLKKYLDVLQIDLSMKTLLKNYLKNKEKKNEI